MSPSYILSVFVDLGASTAVHIIADVSLGLREESSENKLGVALRLGGGGGAEVLLLEPSAGIPALGALDAMLALYIVISFLSEASTAFFLLADAFLDSSLLNGLGELTLCDRVAVHGLVEWLPRSQVVQGIPMALRAWDHSGHGATT